ncbi:MAG: hypothetical protein PHV61_00920 [Limnochordia bacterium]|jgi:hypothetical protein|nr:hypothetical protein [Limnochordia bacterium]MDD2628724.1 hypothetical protein [Limnochordia bacterium]
MGYAVVVYLVLAFVVNLLKHLAEQEKPQPRRAVPPVRPARGKPEVVLQSLTSETESAVEEPAKKEEYFADQVDVELVSKRSQGLSTKQVKQGILLSEILGPPRALRPWRFRR